MKNHAPILILFFISLVAFMGVAIAPAAADTVMNINEFRITTDTASQILPDVDGYHIVYQDNRNGNWDIYLYTLMGTFEPETRITTDPSNQENPAISGNHIVYQDYRNGNWDIYLYDIETGTETRITNNTANQLNPAIYENRIVWQDDRDGHYEIYMYDLSTGTESRITTSVASQDPAIFGNRIVYKKTTLFDGYLFGSVCVFDFATWREVSLSASLDYQSSGNPEPALYGDHAAFVAQHGSSPYPSELYNSDIVLKNVSNPDYDEWITSNTAEQVHPDLYWESNLRYLVWQDNRNGNWDIYVYNPDRQTVTLVTNNAASQQNPAVNGGRIVYQDDRNGNWDIYLAELSYSQIPDTPLPTPIPATPHQTVTPKGSEGETDTGTLYVASIPANATILIDGTDHGRTNGLVYKVPAGNHNLTLTKEGYQDSTMIVTVPAGGLKVLAQITLKQGGPSAGGTGSLYVASNPTNATILINGTDSGRTNQMVSNVPAGIRNLTLIKEGYQQYTTTINVPANGLKVLAPVTLSRAQPGVSGCPCILCVPDTNICIF